MKRFLKADFVAVERNSSGAVSSPALTATVLLKTLLHIQLTHVRPHPQDLEERSTRAAIKGRSYCYW